MKGINFKLSLLALMKISPSEALLLLWKSVAQNLTLFLFRLKPIAHQCVTARCKVMDKVMDKYGT